MATTNKLKKVDSDDMSGADLLRLWSQGYGGNVAASLTQLKNWLGITDASGSVEQQTTQYSSPSSTGFNVLVAENNTWLLLTPTAGFASGTITFPLSSGVANKSEIQINTTQQITAVTFDGNGASAVVGAPSSLASDDAVRFRYDAQSFSWYRISSS